MTRGLTDAPQPEEPEQKGPTNEDIFNFMDQLALHVRDIDTRLSTLERNLFSSMNIKPNAEQESPKHWKKGL
jgi:hypothetical protein